jgi:hypothetical protein
MGFQTPEYILQHCPVHYEAWIHFWLSGVTIYRNMQGSKHELQETGCFIRTIDMVVQGLMLGAQKD